MNAFGPPHGRVFKEMIIVSDPAKPLEFTPKGTPRRHASLVLYASDIEALYTRVAQSAYTEIPPPRTFSSVSTLAYVRDIIQGIMANPELSDEADLFQNGCDR